MTKTKTKPKWDDRKRFKTNTKKIEKKAKTTKRQNLSTSVRLYCTALQRLGIAFMTDGGWNLGRSSKQLPQSVW